MLYFPSQRKFHTFFFIFNFRYLTFGTCVVDFISISYWSGLALLGWAGHSEQVSCLWERHPGVGVVLVPAAVTVDAGHHSLSGVVLVDIHSVKPILVFLLSFLLLLSWFLSVVVDKDVLMFKLHVGQLIMELGLKIEWLYPFWLQKSYLWFRQSNFIILHSGSDFQSSSLSSRSLTLSQLSHFIFLKAYFVNQSKPKIIRLVFNKLPLSWPSNRQWYPQRRVLL